jgi:hypothetical protein
MGIDATAIADTCASGHSIGVDISEWDEWAFGYLGRAVVQTFFAEDTLISAITVWRQSSENLNFNGIYIYVGETDSTGMPLTDHILAQGPTLQRLGDGVSPAEYRYVFDPPLAVPRRDTLAAYFVSNPCGDTFNLFRAKDTQYTAGSLWRTWRGGQVCGLRPNPEHLPEWDLCFTVEFCNLTTPTKRSTWGELKQRYR